MIISDDVRELILNSSDAGSIKRAAVKGGMETLRQDALYKLYMGATSIEEIVRTVNEEENEN